MGLSKRELILLLVLVLCLAIYIFHTYLYMPLVTNTQRLVNENKELETMTLWVSQLDAEENKELLTRKRQEFEKLNKKVPEDVYLPETIKEIEAMSRRNKVRLLKTQYFLDPAKEENAEQAYKEFTMEIQVLGPYFNLTKFVKELEKAERLYTINSIKMTARQGEDNTSENSRAILMTLAFKCYYDNISWDDVRGEDRIVYKNETATDPFAVKLLLNADTN